MNLYLKNKFLGLDTYYYVITFFTLIYILVWSYLSLYRLYTFQSSVFDLGTFVQSLRLILQGNIAYILLMLGSAPFRVLISPIEIVPNLAGILIFQTIFLALPAIPLYAIGKKLIKNQLAALLISSSYLIFFPLAGINWFDVHGQAFFIFFFIMGFYFYISKKYYLSAAFFLLSGTVRFPYMVFPLLFAFLTLLEKHFENKRYQDRFTIHNLQFLLFLFAMSFIVLVLEYYLFSYSPIKPTDVSGSIHLLGGSVFSNIDSKIITVLLFLSPFLFLPIQKFKWVLMLFPYFYLVFYTNDLYYLFPSVVIDQYSSMVTPFLYLGLIDVLATRRGSSPSLIKGRRFLTKIKNDDVLRSAISIFLFILVLAAVFQPYSPISSYSEPNFISNRELNQKSSSFTTFESVVSLIPSNDPFVLMQNSMPEVPLHDPAIFNSYLDSTFGFPYNLTFPQLNGTWTNRIDYVIADSNSNTFCQSGSSPADNQTMFEVIHRLYATGNYGIMAEDDGFILLKHNYTGPIIYYQPTSEQFLPTSLAVLNESYRNGNIITGTNPDGHRIWYGPYTFLSPGQYQVTFQLSTTNNSFENNLELWFGDYAYGVAFKEVQLTGASFPTTNKIYNISVNISVGNFYNGVEFAAHSAYWNGSLSIYGITVKQISNTSISKLISNLVPKEDSYVVNQNNYNNGFPYNLSYELPNGTWTNRIDYVIADSNSNTFCQSGSSPADNQTMFEVIHRLYATGNHCYSYSG